MGVDGALGVGVGVVCDPFGDADGVHERCADAARVRLSEQGDCGHAHVHGFAGGGCSGVGEGVECAVDAVVEGEVVLHGLGASTEFEPVWLYAVCRESGEEIIARGGLIEACGFEEQACVRAGVEDGGPGRDAGG